MERTAWPLQFPEKQNTMDYFLLECLAIITPESRFDFNIFGFGMRTRFHTDKTYFFVPGPQMLDLDSKSKLEDAYPRKVGYSVNRCFFLAVKTLRIFYCSCFCSQQLVVVWRPLVIVLSVSQHGCKACRDWEPRQGLVRDIFNFHHEAQTSSGVEIFKLNHG